MKILYLTPLMQIGGEESSTLTLAKEMTKRKHNVFVKGNLGPMSSEFTAVGATFVQSSKPFRRTIPGILTDASDIHRIVEKEKIDIIHSQSVLPTIAAALAIRRLESKPKLIFHERGISAITYRLLPRILNRISDYAIVNSDHEMRVLERFGLRVKRTRVHNCMNFNYPTCAVADVRAQYGIGQETSVIGIVGRLVPQKGHLILLEAFKTTVKSTPTIDAVILVVGDGPLREQIKRSSVQLGIADRVIFTGFRRDLDNIYAALDILVVPSLFEPFGNVAVEAASHGVPVIASAVGGLPEALCNGDIGVLIPPGESHALSQAILRLLNYPEIADEYGLRAKELVNIYFTPERVGDEVEYVYKTLALKD